MYAFYVSFLLHGFTDGVSVLSTMETTLLALTLISYFSHNSKKHVETTNLTMSLLCKFLMVYIKNFIINFVGIILHKTEPIDLETIS